MIIPKRILEGCARPGSGRTVLEHVYLHIENGQGHAWATDGHIVVSMPVAFMDGEQSTLVPRQAIELADKGKGSLKGLVILTGEGKWLVPGAGVVVEPVEGDFPEQERLANMMHTYGTRLLHVDLALLVRAGKVLGAGHTQIGIWGTDESILYIENREGVRIIVAPLTLESQARQERHRIVQYWSEEALD